MGALDMGGLPRASSSLSSSVMSLIAAEHSAAPRNRQALGVTGCGSNSSRPRITLAQLPGVSSNDLTKLHRVRYIAPTMDKSFNVVFFVLVSALLGLFALLADSYFRHNPMHYDRVTNRAMEKRVP
jgi:hypothetical protein